MTIYKNFCLFGGSGGDFTIKDNKVRNLYQRVSGGDDQFHLYQINKDGEISEITTINASLKIDFNASYFFVKKKWKSEAC